MDDPPATKRPGIGDGLRRLLDARAEERSEGQSQTAVMNHLGHRYVVRVANLSASGAMIVYSGRLAEGDEVVLQLPAQRSVTGRVRWVRDGRMGVSFDEPACTQSIE